MFNLDRTVAIQDALSSIIDGDRDVSVYDATIDDQGTRIVVVIRPDDGLMVVKGYWKEQEETAKVKVELEQANVNELCGYFLRHYKVEP